MSIFLTDPLIDSLRPKPPEEPDVPDYGGQDYPSFPQAQVQQAPQLGTYTPEAAPSTYDYTPQPQPSFYQPGGAVGDVFSGLGSFANRQLEMRGQQQVDENQRAMAQGQAVIDRYSQAKFEPARWAENILGVKPGEIDWNQKIPNKFAPITPQKFFEFQAAQANAETQAQINAPGAAFRLLTTSPISAPAELEMATTPITYVGGLANAGRAIVGAGIGELGKYGVKQAGGTEGQQQAAELIGNVLPFGKDIYGLGKGVVKIGKGAVNLADEGLGGLLGVKQAALLNADPVLAASEAAFQRSQIAAGKIAPTYENMFTPIERLINEIKSSPAPTNFVDFTKKPLTENVFPLEVGTTVRLTGAQAEKYGVGLKSDGAGFFAVKEDGLLARFAEAPKTADANFLRRDPANIARGREALTSRFDMEVRLKRIPEQTAAWGRAFIEALPESYIYNLSSSFVQNLEELPGGAAGEVLAGQYDPVRLIVKISKDVLKNNSDPSRTIIHEIAHHLEQFVSPVDAKQLSIQYARELAGKGKRAIAEYSTAQSALAQLQQNARLGAAGIEGRIAEIIANVKDAPASQVVDALQQVTVNAFRNAPGFEGQLSAAVRRVFQAQKSQYRYTGFPEWFAENITDHFQSEVLYKPAVGIWAKMVDHVKAFGQAVIEATRRVTGREDVMGRVYNDIMDARYNPVERRDLFAGAAAPAARPPGAVPPGGGGTVPPAGSGAPPPIPPSPPSPPSGSTTPEPIQALVDLLVPGEKPGLGILRLYEGAINTQGLVIRRDLNAGNRSLASLKIGRPTAQSRLVQKSPEIEQLFLALHGEAQVPPRLQGVFDTLKEQVAVETAATVGFDPKFMAHPDYFPRGWRTVEVEPANASRARSIGAGSLGSTPGFSKPRVDATFSEILGSIYTRGNGSVYRLEPQSWNPFEQMAIRRVAGAEFREQSILIDRLKQSGTAVVADGPLPEGYRVPRVGAAFEGKPKIALGVDGEPASFYGYTDRYAVEDKIANVLENIYGRRVSFGRGPDAILSAMQLGKQAKLMGSLFQQVDFITRTGFASFGGALDDLISGKPVNAVIKVAKFPVEAGKVVAANLSPARRNLLRNEILSGNAIFPDRPGITLKGVSEAGWNQADITIVRRDINQAFTDSVGDESLTGTAMRNLRRLEAANQRGLFDGVYPQAQTTALKNWVLPRLMRQHPDWTDAQIMGQAADEINKAFSTLGDYQTIFKNPYVQHLTHNLIFSTGEPEALIRGAGSIFVGNNKRLWATYYLGGFVFLAATANLIHMASTALMGNMETLPVMRYNPLKIDQNAPFNLKYNTRFLSPDTPIPGEGGVRTAMDLVGQMDTALRLLNPLEFLTSRLNVGPRAIQNQISGTDYYGNRIDTVGPKGIVSRALQFATDLYEPITANQIRTQVISPKGIREPVGRIGGAVQAAGINLRPESPSAAVDRGDFESLSGEAQLQGLRRKTWNEVKYLEGEDAPASFYEWYKKESEAQIERFSEYGFNPLEALSLAEKNMQKNDLVKLYRAKHNKAENEWAVTNPRLAYEILLREKDLKFYEKTFSPSPGVKKLVGFASQSDDEGN